MLRKTVTLTLLVFVISLSLISQKTIAQNLTLHLLTDRDSYFMGDTVTIYGNLTQDDQPAPSALVAIQVENSSKIIVLRTLQTEPADIIFCPLYIWRVIPCDKDGNPQTTFPRPPPGGASTAYFKVEFANYGNETTVSLMTVNIYDSTGIPLGYSALENYPTPPDQSIQFIIFPIEIPSDARLGNATVYASAFTDWPKLNGTAYCPEKNATFEITGSGGYMTSNYLQTLISQSSTIEFAGEDGTYNMTFRLNTKSTTGTYTIYAAAQYQSLTAAANKTFEVGIKGDINRDGVVDSTDLGLLGFSWGALLGDPNYNPDADLNEDEAVDSSDLGILGMYWGSSV